MHQEAFEKLEADEASAVLERLNPALSGSAFDAQSATILAQKSQFYPGFRYLDIADYSSVPPKKSHALCSKDRIIILDYTNAPIYALNESLPIFLNDQTVEDYVRFFFRHVRGQHGQFIIVEGIDDIRWKDDPPPTARKAISKLITPLSFKGIDERGNFLVSASIVFKDSLFRSKIRVQPDGRIILFDEELLLEDIPVLDDILGQ